MPSFDYECVRCPRLSGFLAEARRQHPTYYAHPVPPFGSHDPSLLIVGLAPGFHGANATGRPFTGDHAGLLLYKTLHAHGFANQPNGADPRDGLELLGCRISNAVKCVPPGNKPSPQEIRTCNVYLRAEINELKSLVVMLALGKIAHDAVLMALDKKPSQFKFVHAAEHRLDDHRVLVDSYHCSRYNTQTRRLTEAMFLDVVAAARRLIKRRNA